MSASNRRSAGSKPGSRLAQAKKAAFRALVTFLIVVNVLVLAPALFFSVAMGDYTASIVAVALSLAFWLALTLVVQRRARRRAGSAASAASASATSRTLSIRK